MYVDIGDMLYSCKCKCLASGCVNLKAPVTVTIDDILLW